MVTGGIGLAVGMRCPGQVAKIFKADSHVQPGVGFAGGYCSAVGVNCLGELVHGAQFVSDVEVYQCLAERHGLAETRERVGWRPALERSHPRSTKVSTSVSWSTPTSRASRLSDTAATPLVIDD